MVDVATDPPGPPPTAQAAIVTCGTGQFLVLPVPGGLDEGERRALVGNLALSDDAPSRRQGPGEVPPQADRVVLVEHLRAGVPVAFRCYQVSWATGRVYAGTEDSNAAAAAAAWACRHRPELFVAAGPARTEVTALDLGTERRITLQPPVSAPWWQGRWTARFTHSAGIGRNLTQQAEAFTVADPGGVVEGHIVQHGHVFVLAQRAPDRASDRLVAALDALGEDFRRRRKLGTGLSKVVLYGPNAPEEDVLRCPATCYSSGREHPSLSDSAAMTLAAFLTVHGPAAPVRTLRGDHLSVQLRHPSGTTTIGLELAGADGARDIVASSITIPVRLLFAGLVAL